jgi:hypothetical protein
MFDVSQFVTIPEKTVKVREYIDEWVKYPRDQYFANQQEFEKKYQPLGWCIVEEQDEDGDMVVEKQVLFFDPMTVPLESELDGQQKQKLTYGYDSEKRFIESFGHYHWWSCKLGGYIKEDIEWLLMPFSNHSALCEPLFSYYGLVLAHRCVRAKGQPEDPDFPWESWIKGNDDTNWYKRCRSEAEALEPIEFLKGELYQGNTMPWLHEVTSAWGYEGY